MSALTKILKHASPKMQFRLMEVCGIKLPHVLSDEQPHTREIDLQLWIKSHLSKDQLAQLKASSDRIDTMTDDLGYQALICEYSGFVSGHTPMKTRHDLSIELYCNHHHEFRRAEEIRYVNHHREGRAWDSFLVPECPPFSDTVDHTQMKEALRDYFKTKDAFYLETYPLHDNWNKDSVQWLTMIYREGLQKSFLELDPNNEVLLPGLYQPVREYALIYTPATGIIEVVSSRHADRRELSSLFAKHCLASNATLTVLAPRTCCLTQFYSEPSLPFFDDHPIEEDILWVRVSAGTWRSPVTGLTNTTRCSLRRLPEQHFYKDLAENDLITLLDNGKLHLKSVRLSMAFKASRDGHLPKETLSFSITLPNKCTLKPHGIRHRYIRDILFPRWNITPS